MTLLSNFSLVHFKWHLTSFIKHVKMNDGWDYIALNMNVTLLFKLYPRSSYLWKESLNNGCSTNKKRTNMPPPPLYFIVDHETTQLFCLKFNLSDTIYFLKHTWFLYVLSEYRVMTNLQSCSEIIGNAIQ